MQACAECGCDTFVANPFNKSKCTNCFHVHGDGDGGGPPKSSSKPPPPLSKQKSATGMIPTPGSNSTIVASASTRTPESGGSGHSARTSFPGSGATRGSPQKSSAPAPARAASQSGGKPKAGPPPKARRASTRPAPPAASRAASSSSSSSSSAPSSAAAGASSRPRNTIPAVSSLPAGAFASLDDVLAHVSNLKRARLDQLAAASFVLQRVFRVYLERQRAKCGALADTVVSGCDLLRIATSLMEVDMGFGRVDAASNRAPLRASLLPFFLRPVNLELRPESVNSKGDPMDGAPVPAFMEPPEIVAFADELRIQRTETLHQSQMVIRRAYFGFADGRQMRGAALAEGSVDLLLYDMCTATSEQQLERNTTRLSVLPKLIPATDLALPPFLEGVNTGLPPPGDEESVAQSGLGVVLQQPFDTVDSFLTYADAVRAHRRSVLDSAQMRIRVAFQAYKGRLALRAQGLADLVSSRVIGMGSAASDLELDKLYNVVVQAVELIPKPDPAPGAFLAQSRAGLAPTLPQDAPPFTSTAQVIDHAAAECAARMEVLNACASRIAAAYRRYRHNLVDMARALGTLVVSVLYEFAAATSGEELGRLEWRLETGCDRVPIKDPEALAACLEVVEADYSVVQAIDQFSVPMPPFDTTTAIVEHGKALSADRLATLNNAHATIVRAFKGHKARVGFAAVAMAELVMNTIRTFECALDREMDILSDRVSSAMARVRGNPDAERLFLEALNQHMAERN